MNDSSLPPFYYLDNLLQLLQRAESLPADLLSASEQSFCLRFRQLALMPQALLVRLLTRKGRLFRAERLCWAEITDNRLASGPLADSGLLQILSPQQALVPSIEHPEWLALYSRDELLKVMLPYVSSLNVTASALRAMRREALLNTFDTALKAGILRRQDVQQYDWWLLADECQTILDTLRLLYFGNLQQSLTDFVLRDLGLARYEAYSLDAGDGLFRSRRQVELHLEFYRTRPDKDWIKQASVDELTGYLQDLPVAAAEEIEDSLLLRRIDSVRVTIARQLERLGAIDEALGWYEGCLQYPARERRIRILATREPAKALFLCQQAWQSPGCDNEWQFLQSFVPRLLKQLRKQPSYPADVSWYQPAAAVNEHYLTLPDDWKTRWNGNVEQACLALLLDDLQGADNTSQALGFYVENALISSVFGLLYWPVIFATVPGAFFHPFQYRPDDLYEADFLQRRQLPLAAVEQLLVSGDWQQQVMERALYKAGIQNTFVHWEFVAQALENGCLQLALDRIPLSDWRAIFAFIWQDVRNHRSGLPDLILFPPDGGFQLLEVKGPGDQLQANQKSWLAWFAQHDIAAAVVYARPAAENVSV
jgi:hypothetical protein